MTIETLVLSFGYAAILVFMITNGVISLPSSQFIYVTAGFFVPTGELSLWLIVTAGTVGNVVGNTVLYELSRAKGIVYLKKWRRFPEEKILMLQRAFERRGAVIIFFGKFLPGVKVVIPVVAGIAKMNRVSYCIIITATSGLWALGLTSIGYYFGKNYAQGAFGWHGFALIVLTCGALYLFHRYIQNVQLK